MNAPAAGSDSAKVRANVQGHIVLGPAGCIRALRRLSTIALSQLFLHAKEQGSGTVTLNDESWLIVRHPDHTFTLQPGHNHRPMV